MRTQSAHYRDDLLAAIEGCVLLLLIASGALALELRWLSLGAAVRLSVVFLSSLLLLAWKRFDGGRHPCFLFLGMLLVFQGGRLIGYTFGILDDPFQIIVQTAIPIDISRSSASITLLLITLSAVSGYLPSRWRFKPAKLEDSRAKEWLPFAYVLLALTFPLMLYKNYLYFSFVRSHGGYLSVYTDSDAIVHTAGTLVRTVSLIAFNLFLIVFVLERRWKFVVPIAVLFLASTFLELLIGFRGKAFLLVITLWYLNNLKRGTGFRLVPLAATFAILSLLAVAVAGFRENRATVLFSPVEFISGQGVSLGVTETAVEFRRVFQPHGMDYLFYSLETSYKPSGTFQQGQIFDNDVSVFLNLSAFLNGFAAGGSYLAESYIVGGILFTAICSIVIGCGLRVLHNASGYASGAVALAMLMPGMIYLPRTGLFEPIASGIKNLIAAYLIYACLWMLRRGSYPFKGSFNRLPISPLSYATPGERGGQRGNAERNGAQD